MFTKGVGKLSELKKSKSNPDFSIRNDFIATKKVFNIPILNKNLKIQDNNEDNDIDANVKKETNDFLINNNSIKDYNKLILSPRGYSYQDLNLINDININTTQKQGLAFIYKNDPIQIDNIVDFRDCVNVNYNMVEAFENKHYEMSNLLDGGNISFLQYKNINTCYVAITKSFYHNLIVDFIGQRGDNITYMYHVITTNPRLVNFGGINIFPPVTLFYDANKNTTFYMIKLSLYNTIPKKNFFNIFKEQNKDNIELQKILVENAIRVEKENGEPFPSFHIKYDFFEKPVLELDFEKSFKIKDAKHLIKPWENNNNIRVKLENLDELPLDLTLDN